eukprot:1161044-Pelagomonas_calceolata.AAC.2
MDACERTENQGVHIFDEWVRMEWHMSIGAGASKVAEPPGVEELGSVRKCLVAPEDSCSC